MSEIPTLDLSKLTSNPDGLAQDFADAYGTVGFGAIVNHGISRDLIDGVFKASRRFHALPSDRKRAIALNDLHRGFIEIDSSTDRVSTLAEVTKPNQSESFMAMREAGPDDPDVQAGLYLAGPNQWPDGLDGFREAVEAYDQALCDLGRKLVRLAARSLGASEDSFTPAFERPTTWLRLLFYPEQPDFIPGDLFGSAPHCDFGALTILAQDDAGGLQVMKPDGGWIDVPPNPDAFVVNVGDMLSRWSNGRLKSTPHRVINRSGRARYSVPFFFDPNMATEIAPLPCCVAEGAEPDYPPIRFDDFVRSQLEASYEAHGAEG